MILSILNQSEANPSTLAKTAILEQNKDNELFKRVLFLAYNPRIKYYIKAIPEYAYGMEELSLSDALEQLSKLSNREVTGQEASNFLSSLLSLLSDDDREVLQRTIKRDLRCGINTSLINKTFGKNFIPETPYMGCKSFSEKLTRDLFAKYTDIVLQKKEDGLFTNSIVFPNGVSTESRQGEEQIFKGLLLEELNSYKLDFPYVLNGELLMDSSINRHEANGMISSIISINKKISKDIDVSKELKKFVKSYNMTLDEAQDKLRYVVWDMLPYEEYQSGKGKTLYRDRLNLLNKTFKDSKLITVVETHHVKSIAEAMRLFQEYLANGDEGAVLKALMEPWVDGKPNYQVKMKVEMTLDLEIVGFNAGKAGTKYENTLGSLEVQTSDGLLFTSCGSGLDDSGIRDEIWNNRDSYLNKIVEIKCNGLSSNKKGGNSLLFPVFMRVRDDKYTANTFKECEEIQEMALELKQ